MFYYLRRIAGEFGGRFREFLDRNLPTELLRGVHLHVDPYWVEAALRWRFGPLWRPHLEGQIFWDEIYDHGVPDRWRPRDWERHNSLLGFPGNAHPARWRVIFREDEHRREFKAELPRTFEGPFGPIPIRYEARPPAIALLAPGDSLGQQTPATDGTLGGFLIDTRSLDPYLVTCAHVAAAGNDVFSPATPAGAGARIRSVAHAVLPPPDTGSGCNRFTHHPPPALDLAIARIHAPQPVNYYIPGIGQPTAVTTIRAMASNQPVSLYGRKSKLVQAELGSLCVYHEVTIAGAAHCFGDLFTLTPPKPWYVNTALVKGGDSGAWIIRSTGGLVGWDGMLIAGDGATGYACFAENIMDECRTALPNLALP